MNTDTQLAKNTMNGKHSLSVKEVGEELNKFIGNLNQQPLSTDIKTNAQANNSKYLTIASIEQELDYQYKGLWSTDNFRWQVVANEIIGSIDLKVFHPITMSWITRTGCGSAMIQQKKDSDIKDIGAKIKNTLVKDFPHLKAECIKNAAKSLGAKFGRNLNRIGEDDLDKLYSMDEHINAIEAAKSRDELSDLWKEMPKTAKNDLYVKEVFNKKRSELNGK